MSDCHLAHENNDAPHFNRGVKGSWDTFPVRTLAGTRRYQPKYKSNCVKFNAIVTLQGLFAFVSGPHPGSMSDTVIARMYRPQLGRGITLLGDKANISVPNCLVPITYYH